MLRPILILLGFKQGAACCAPTRKTAMELKKEEIEKVEIFLIELNRKMDLFIEAQAASGKKAEIKGLIAKKELH